MKNIIRTVMALAIMLSTVSCYDNFTMPEKTKEYSDADFSYCDYISIKDLLAEYRAKLNPGHNTDFDRETTYSQITDNRYIKGKLISSDEGGDVYKSMYIQEVYEDGDRAAIQIKAFRSNYLNYPVGSIIYIKLKDLVISDYRCALSIGAVSNNEEYTSANIENSIMIKEHIFKGETLPMVAADTMVITKDNYKDLTDTKIGCLMRFEGVESCFGPSLWGYKNVFPNYFYEVDDDFVWDSGLGWDATFSYIESETGKRAFGSAWYSYDRKSADIKGQYVIRAGTYSKFNKMLIPADGSICNITAIYNRYSKDLTTNGRAAYQLVLSDVNRFEIVSTPPSTEE